MPRKTKPKKRPSNPMSAMRAARIAAGYTPEAAAKKLGYCRDYVMQLERAGMGPYLFNMRAAQLYGVSVNLFIYCPKNTKIGNIIVNPAPAPAVPVRIIDPPGTAKAAKPKTPATPRRPKTEKGTKEVIVSKARKSTAPPSLNENQVLPVPPAARARKKAS